LSGNRKEEERIVNGQRVNLEEGQEDGNDARAGEIEWNRKVKEKRK